MSSNAINDSDNNSDVDMDNVNSDNIIKPNLELVHNNHNSEVKYDDDIKLSINSFAPDNEDIKYCLEENENFAFEISCDLREEKYDKNYSEEIDETYNNLKEESNILSEENEIKKINDALINLNDDINDQNYEVCEQDEKGDESITNSKVLDDDSSDIHLDYTSEQHVFDSGDMLIKNETDLKFGDKSPELNEELSMNESKHIISPNEMKEKPKVFKKFEIKTTNNSTCEICSKYVYPMEKLLMNNKCYHKACFKCCKCGKSLSPTVVSTFNGIIFCKTHYIELFIKRGRYDDINDSNNDEPIISYKHDLRKDLQECFASEDYVISSNPASEGSSVYSRDEPLTRVADVKKAWSEGQIMNKTEWKKNNSNNSNQVKEFPSVNTGVKVKNLAAMFESRNE